MLKRNRLTRFGYVTRNGNAEQLEKIKLLEVPERRRPGGPKETQYKKVDEHLGENGAVEEDSLDIIGTQTPQLTFQNEICVTYHKNLKSVTNRFL